MSMKLRLALVGLAWTLGAGVLWAQSVVPTVVEADRSLDVPSRSMPADHGPWVVRAYFDDVRSLNLLLRRAVPWNASIPDGMLTIEVDNRFEYQRLLDEGFRVAVDPLLTAQLRQPAQRLPGQISAIPGFTCYRTVEETFAAADALLAARPEIVEIVDIGDSWAKQQNPANGYDLKVLKLTNRSIGGRKPAHFLMGGLHAREYVTAETVTRYGEWLVAQYGVNPDVTWVLDHHEVHILMQANPDGRKVAEISSTNSQRKNRNLNFCSTGSTTVGVDLNRNFPFDWAGPGSSATPCADNFRGPASASEVESQAIITYLRTIFDDQRTELPGVDLTTGVSLDVTGIYMDVHSNAARNWFSWGNSSTAAPNASQLLTLGRKLSFYNGYRAEVGSAGGSIGGATDDFVYGTLGVPAFTVEMDGSGFFPSCSTYESSIVQKNLNAFWAASRTMRAPLRWPAGPELVGAQLSPDTLPAAGSGVLSVQAADNRFTTVGAGGSEPAQTVAAIAVYLSPPWLPGATPIGNMSASDGSFDSAVENASFTLPAALLAAGRQLVYLQATDSAGNRGPVAAVFATRSAASGLVIQSGDVNFGNVAAGFTSEARTVVLDNEGATALTVSALEAPLAPFARSGGSCAAAPFVLAAGTSCTLQYTFSPTVAGAASQALALTVSGGSGSGSITLSGTGLQGLLQLSVASLAFGEVAPGSSAEASISLGNSGNTSLNINSITTPLAPFSRVGGSCSTSVPFTLLVGGSCTLIYRFTPQQGGPVSQFISIGSSGAGPGGFELGGSGALADPILADGFE